MTNGHRPESFFKFTLLSVLLLSCQSVQYKEIKQDETVKQAKEVKQDVAVNFAFKAYPVSVDYGRSLNEMVMAGKYDLMNDTDITVDNFSVAAKEVVDVNLYLVHLNRVVSDEGVIQDLDQLGLKPAKIEHLLAFGAKYPNKQLDFPIVALGSAVVDPLGRHYVSYLDRLNDVWEPRRCLYLFSEVEKNNSWSEACRFLAVRK